MRRSRKNDGVVLHDPTITFLSDFFDYMRGRGDRRRGLNDDNVTPMTVRLPNHVLGMVEDLSGEYSSLSGDVGEGGAGQVKKKKGMASVNYTLSFIVKTFFDAIYRPETLRPEMIRHRFAMLCNAFKVSPIRIIKIMNAMSCDKEFDLSLFDSMPDAALMDAVENDGAAKILSLITGINEEWLSFSGASDTPFEEQMTVPPIVDISQLGVFTHLTMTPQASYFPLPSASDDEETPKLEWHPAGVKIFASSDPNLPRFLFIEGAFVFEKSKISSLLPIGIAYPSKPESMKIMALAALRSKSVGIPVYEVEVSETGIRRMLQGRHPLLAEGTPYGVLGKGGVSGVLVDFASSPLYTQYKTEYSEAIQKNMFLKSSKKPRFWV